MFRRLLICLSPPPAASTLSYWLFFRDFSFPACWCQLINRVGPVITDIGTGHQTAFQVGLRHEVLMELKSIKVAMPSLLHPAAPSHHINLYSLSVSGKKCVVLSNLFLCSYSFMLDRYEWVVHAKNKDGDALLKTVLYNILHITHTA
jgi:hypothetical protein